MALIAILGLAAAGLEALFLAALLLGNLKAQAVEFISLALAAGVLPPRGECWGRLSARNWAH